MDWEADTFRVFEYAFKIIIQIILDYLIYILHHVLCTFIFETIKAVLVCFSVMFDYMRNSLEQCGIITNKCAS